MTSTLPRPIRIGLTLSIALVLLALSGLLALKMGLGPAQGLPILARMPAFHLVDQTGQPVTPADLSGKPLLVSFIYTSCPDICPMVTAEMRAIQEELARRGLLGQVQLLSISVDPERDTPERLKEYAAMYGAQTDSWRFLTGDPAHVRSVVVDGFMMGMVAYQPADGQGKEDHRNHGVASVDHSNHGGTTDAAGENLSADLPYLVEHSGLVALIDRNGGIRAYHTGTLLEHQLIQDQLRQLLRER